MQRVCISVLLVTATAWADEGISIQPGQWRLVSERVAEIRMLGMKKQGKSEVLRCLSAQPMEDLRDWLQSKNCPVHEVSATVDGAKLTGECSFKLLPGALPMQGSLQRNSATQFSLNLSAGRPGMSYQENTLATRIGDCSAAGG